MRWIASVVVFLFAAASGSEIGRAINQVGLARRLASSRNAVGCVQFYPVARSFVVMAIGDACDMGFGKVCSRPLNPKNIHFPYWRRRENAKNTNFSFRVRTLGRDPDGEIEVPKSQQTIAPPARSGKRSRSEGRMGWERKHRISEKRYAFVFPVP